MSGVTRVALAGARRAMADRSRPDEEETMRRAMSPRAATLWMLVVGLVTGGRSAAVVEPTGQKLPSLRQLHTIGCADCSGPEALAVLDVALTDDGTVLVLNEFEPFVRVFDAAGELVRTFGREGQGPGELQLPGWMYLNADGSLHVFDASTMSFAGYELDGTPGDAVRYPVATGLVPIATAWDAPRELLYMVGFRPMESVPKVARFPFDGSGLEVLWEGAELPGVEPEVEARPASFGVAVGPAGEVAVGNGERYRIAVHDASGALLRELSRDLPRPAKTEAELEEERQRLTTREPDPEKLHFPARGLQFDGRGRLWISTEHHGPGETAFDLFDVEGEGGYLGTLELPVEVFWRIPAFEIRNGRMAAVVFDETGNTFVTVWEVDG